MSDRVCESCGDYADEFCEECGRCISCCGCE